MGSEMCIRDRINDEIISAMAARVIPGATIIEIGAGLGQVTEALAQAAEPGSGRNRN